MAKVDKTATCWLWTGSLDKKGYGRFKHKGRPELVHRLSYTFFKGPIPPGLEIHHTCNVTRCVNPAHLEPVTSSVNNRIMQGWSLRDGNWYCKNNHLMNETNYNKQCKICQSNYQREWFQRRKLL